MTQFKKTYQAIQNFKIFFNSYAEMRISDLLIPEFLEPIIRLLISKPLVIIREIDNITFLCSPKFLPAQASSDDLFIQYLAKCWSTNHNILYFRCIKTRCQHTVIGHKLNAMGLELFQ